MDSQLTLVDPSPPISLIFDTNSMTNATLSLNSIPAYTISTDSRGTSTELRAAGTGEVLVRIVRKGMFPDTIAFPNIHGGKDVRLNKWLKSAAKLPDGSPVSVIETEVGKCFLRKYRLYRLALFTETDMEAPVAHLQRPTVATPLPLALILQPGTETFRPEIIAAFIVQEQKTRMEEEAQKEAQDRANIQYKAAIYGPSHGRMRAGI
ncbi:hypothetical protein C8R44DRAFT_821152 [Mycena epipterygia]|nr:hypothetical protein C8R44DRAFT_821152 [Mycena epipterygia]